MQDTGTPLDRLGGTSQSNRAGLWLLRLEDTYDAKIRPPLHVSLNNSINKRWSNKKIIEGNVQGGSEFSTIRIF